MSARQDNPLGRWVFLPTTRGAQAIELYKAGLSTHSIAAMCRVSQSLVVRSLKHFGVPMRAPGRWGWAAGRKEAA